MSAGVYNIEIEQGATFHKVIVYKDAAGNPVDLTTVSEVRAQMRPTAASGSALDFVCTVLGDPTEGTIDWSMPATTTDDITTLSQVYDLEIEWADGTVKRLLEGNVTISAEVTRS